MKSNEFLGELKKQGKNVPWLSEQLKENEHPVSVSTIYKKLRGDSEFTAAEIKIISQALNFSNEKMFDIFFEELVS